jgi:O-antigen/teichoic acid export membrane protein
LPRDFRLKKFLDIPTPISRFKKLFASERVSDTYFIFVSNLVFSLTLLGLQVIVTRSTSLAEFGKYATVQAFEAIVEAAFLARGQEMALQRVGRAWMKNQFSLARYEARRVIFSDLVINTVIFILILLFAYTLGARFGLEPTYLTLLAALIPLQSGYGVLKSLFTISGNLKSQARFETAMSLLMFALGALGCTLGGIPGLIIGFLIYAFLKTCFAWLVTRNFWPPTSDSHPDLKETGKSIEWGFASLFRNGLASGSANLDIILLNMALGPEKAALYKIAKSLATIPSRFSAPIWSSTRPPLLRAWHNRDISFLKKSISHPALLLLALLVVGIPIAWFTGPFLLGLYGSQYSQGRLVFLLLFIGNWLWVSCTGWVSFWIIITESQKWGIVIQIALILAILFVGHFYNQSDTHMAAGICGVYAAISVVCWVMFLSQMRTLALLKRVVTTNDQVKH